MVSLQCDDAASVVRTFVNVWDCWDPPDVIHSDNGSELGNTVVSVLFELLDGIL